MAERRMFSKTIISSDAFLDMPAITRSLYYHLSMFADDDGFINNPKSLMRSAKAKEKDLDLLEKKKFIIYFRDEGIVVIKHWKISNSIRGDTYHETKYKELKDRLCLDENNAYTEIKIPESNERESTGPVTDRLQERTGGVSVQVPVCNEPVTEPLHDCNENVSLVKDSIDQDSIDQKKDVSVSENPETKKPDSPAEHFMYLWQHNGDVFNALASFKKPNEWNAFWARSAITIEQIDRAITNFIEAIKSGAMERRFVPANPDTFVLNGWILKSQDPYRKQSPPPSTGKSASGPKKSLGGLEA
jgi:hypothetical protein